MSPEPPDNGRRACLAGLIDYLTDRLGPERVHFALVTPPGTALPQLPCQVHQLPAPSTWQKIMSLAVGPALRRRSFQEAMLSSAPLRREVSRLVAKIEPDIEIYDTIRLAQHRREAGARGRQLVLLDDLYSVRYERMLQMGKQVSIDPLGEFATHVPGVFRPLARRRSVSRRLLQWERDLVEARERRSPADFDTVLLVSAREAEQLQAATGRDNIRVLTPHVRPSAATAAARSPARPAELVFLGRLTVPHNDDALQTFLREVMPVVAVEQPGLRLRVVGRGPGAVVRQLAERYGPSVTFEGFVEDLDAVLARACGVIAPLRFGTGIKLKVLDALARGVPVLGTAVAFEGIPARPDGHDGCLIEDDLHRWPSLLNDLIDPTVNDEVSAAAARFFATTYSTQVIYQQYDKIFRGEGPAT